MASYSELVTATVELNLTDFRAKMKSADVSLDRVREQMKTNGSTTTFVTAGDMLLQAGIEALKDFAEQVMVESLVEVPKDTEILAYSHNVLPPVRVANRVKVTLGYGYGDEINEKTGRRAAQYALPVHEIYEAYHEPPTKDHYLLDPLLAQSSRFGPSLSAAMRRTGSYQRITTMVKDGKLLGTSDIGVLTEVPAMSGSVVQGTMIRGAGGRFAGAKGAFRGAGFKDSL